MDQRLVPAQIRGARSMLGWSMTDLAKAAEMSVSTVKRVEDGIQHSVSDANFSNIRKALELAGVRFLDHADGVDGLQIRFKSE